MKNKTKIILCITVILVALIILIGLNLIKSLEKYTSYTFIVRKIDGDVVIAQPTDTVNLQDDLEHTQYMFSTNNIIIKDENGKKISGSDLKVGDEIRVIRKKERVKLDIAYSIETLDNIKIIKVLNRNSVY